MTLYQFKSLSKDQQTELLWIEGDFVADRQEDACCILLYQLYSFYVEIMYDNNVNQFQIYRSFSSTDQLVQYLEEIDITTLLN